MNPRRVGWSEDVRSQWGQGRGQPELPSEPLGWQVAGGFAGMGLPPVSPPGMGGSPVVLPGGGGPAVTHPEEHVEEEEHVLHHRADEGEIIPMGTEAARRPPRHGPGPSSAEPSRAELSRMVPSLAEPSRAQPSRSRSHPTPLRNPAVSAAQPGRVQPPSFAHWPVCLTLPSHWWRAPSLIRRFLLPSERRVSPPHLFAAPRRLKGPARSLFQPHDEPGRRIPPG